MLGSVRTSSVRGILSLHKFLQEYGYNQIQVTNSIDILDGARDVVRCTRSKLFVSLSPRGVHSCSTNKSTKLNADLQIKVPQLGESITDGTVAAIMKSPGDSIEEDETILQIETDKVTVDVRAPISGVVKAILAEQSQTVDVGSIVGIVTKSDKEKTEDVYAHNVSNIKAKEPHEAVNLARQGNAKTGSNSVMAYQPKISFPIRRTADGRLISNLPAEMQEMRRNEEFVARETAKFLERRRPSVTRPPLPPRRELSLQEMEAVMLGGTFD